MQRVEQAIKFFNDICMVSTDIHQVRAVDLLGTYLLSDRSVGTIAVFV